MERIFKVSRKKYNSKVKEVYFRSKTYGYHSGTMTIIFKNGMKYTGSNRVDLYNKSFHSNKVSRYSCYNCPAKGLDRVSDFTVFDSWKPEALSTELMDNDKGFSNLIIHSQKGKEIFKHIKSKFNVWEIDAMEAAVYTGEMLDKSIKMPEDRLIIYEDILNDNLMKIKKYVRISIWDKLFEKSKKILYKLGVLKYFKKVKENLKIKLRCVRKNMVQDLISVVIPVYNVEKYLKRCIDSVLKQSYLDIEIIIVDDGSTDSSGIICDKYEKKTLE